MSWLDGVTSSADRRRDAAQQQAHAVSEFVRWQEPMLDEVRPMFQQLRAGYEKAGAPVEEVQRRVRLGGLWPSVGSKSGWRIGFDRAYHDDVEHRMIYPRCYLHVNGSYFVAHHRAENQLACKLLEPCGEVEAMYMCLFHRRNLQDARIAMQALAFRDNVRSADVEGAFLLRDEQGRIIIRKTSIVQSDATIWKTPVEKLLLDLVMDASRPR